MDRPKVADALTYLDQVKNRFANQGAIYNDFLEVMRQFKAQSIGTDIVIRRVRELFDGHPDLILGFNTFIPQGYRLECPPGTTRPATISVTASGQTYQSDASPGKLPSFAAFRHSESPSGTATTIAPTLPFQPIPQNSETHLTQVVSQPPVLRSQLTLVESQPQALSTQSFSRILTNNNLPALDGHMYSPIVQQPSFVGNVQQQQQHNAQSFNHAMAYVNKVKNRFQTRPDTYKNFLEILQWYQREQDHTDSHRRKEAEKRVYQDVAKLLHGHDDLLQEFSRFLPESTSMTSESHDSRTYHSAHTESSCQGRFASSTGVAVESSASWHRIPSETVEHLDTKKLKRAAGSSSTQAYSRDEVPPPKRSRHVSRDTALMDLGVLSGPETILLQRIRNALDADDTYNYYQSLLQHLSLYNRKAINEKTLMQAVEKLLHRHPDLISQLYDLFVLNLDDDSHPAESGRRSPTLEASSNASSGLLEGDAKRNSSNNPISSSSPSEVCVTTGGNSIHPRTGSDLKALVSEVSQKRFDLDFNKLRVCGASYRMLPPDFLQPKCSGRAKCPIARSVLNDSYISFSSLTSEDSQFVSSKKNIYEEAMYHTEDERYEADMVMEVNRDALTNLRIVQRRISNMTVDEVKSFRLDDNLGGTSAILMRKAIHRVYGDRAIDVVHGLKVSPDSVIPLVISRMEQKEKEWKDALRLHKQTWAEADFKNYLRSLDHQGVMFKNRDLNLTRPKAIVNIIENLVRKENSRSSNPPTNDTIGAMLGNCTMRCHFKAVISPGILCAPTSYLIEGSGEDGDVHLTLEYPPPEKCASLLQDAASLIIHHLKRQSNTSKEDKRTMKLLVRTVLQDLFMQERYPMSDDDGEDDGSDKSDNEDYDQDENDEGGRDSENYGGRSVDSEAVEIAGGGPTPRRVRKQRARHQARHQRRDGACVARSSPTPSVQGDARPQGKRFKRKSSCVCGQVPDQTRHGGLPCQRSDNETNTPPEEFYCVLYGNNQWFAFLRLHHILITRLAVLRERASVMQKEFAETPKNANNTPADALRMRTRTNVDPSFIYSSALQHVKDLLDGAEEVHLFEERMRDMFGIYAYPWYTMDRLIINMVKQLHSMASNDDLSQQLTSLFREYFKSPGNTSLKNYPSENPSDKVPPVINAICGPLRSRYSRLEDELQYRQRAFYACLDVATTSNDDDEASRTEPRLLPPPSQIPNCFTLVMLRQASKMLVRLHDPEYLIKMCSSGVQEAPVFVTPSYPSPPPILVPPPSPASEERAENALIRAKDEKSEVRHWYDYLARYLLLPGCWTRGPVSSNLVARVRPVFLYRNVRRCVEELTRQALGRKKAEAVASIDPQPEEVILNSIKDEQPQGGQESFEKGTLEVMTKILRNNLTREEIFRDTYSSDCMQSNTTMKSGGSTSRAAYKIKWSVGSYGIFVRLKKRSIQPRKRAVEKFRAFQQRFIEQNGIKEEVDSVTALLKRKSGGSPCTNEDISEFTKSATDAECELVQSVTGNEVGLTNDGPVAERTRLVGYVSAEPREADEPMEDEREGAKVASG